MQAFVKHKGLVAPLDRMNVDTDLIIPKQFLKRIEKSGFGQFVFYEMRYDENENIIEDSIFNMPRYSGASVLISRANFGCGSSREHAPWALADYGFRAIIAPSFADIFYNNSLNNGILVIKLPNEALDELFKRVEATPGYELEIDLEAKLVKDNSGLAYSFDLDEFNRNKLLNGFDDISLTLLNEADISEFEKHHNVYI